MAPGSLMSGSVQDGRDAVAGLKDEMFLLFCGGERKDRGLLREVGVGVGRVSCAGAACASAPAATASPLIGAGLTGGPAGGCGCC